MTKRRIPCPRCGHVKTQHRHTLSPILVTVLKKLWDAGGGPIKLGALNLSYSEQSNAQKLRYWGFIAKADDSKKRGGEWVLTTYGQWFLTGRFKVRKHVWSEGGYAKEREGPMVSLYDVDANLFYCLNYSDYSTEMKKRYESTMQMELKLKAG